MGLIDKFFTGESKVESLEEENERLNKYIIQVKEELNQLIETFKHMHINNGHNNDDSCKQCGLDLRNPIHFV